MCNHAYCEFQMRFKVLEKDGINFAPITLFPVKQVIVIIITNYFFYFRCTVDPVLFENFLTEDGDLLRAKFQAFKFPETNFVLFKGVVNVCLDRCNGVSISLFFSILVMTQVIRQLDVKRSQNVKDKIAVNKHEFEDDAVKSSKGSLLSN